MTRNLAVAWAADAHPRERGRAGLDRDQHDAPACGRRGARGAVPRADADGALGHARRRRAGVALPRERGGALRHRADALRRRRLLGRPERAMAEPLWRSRPDRLRRSRPPTACARPGIDDFIYLSEGNSNAYLIVTPRRADRRQHRHGLRGAGAQGVLRLDRSRPGALHRADAGPRRSRGRRRRLPRAGHRDRRAREQRRAAGVRRAARAVPRAAERLRVRARLRAHGGRRARAPPVQSRPTPTIPFEERYAFTLGGVRFELDRRAPAPRPRTRCVVWLPEHRICFTGNVFGALFGHFPNLVTIRGDRHRDALRYVETLDVLLGARRRDAAGRALRAGASGATSSAPSSSACGAPCCTCTTRWWRR